MNNGKLNILQEADQLTMGDRQRDYDHPLPNHERIAAMWNAYFASCGQAEWLGPRDIARMMILLKIARQIHTPKRDNLVDICGYARCEERMDEPQKPDENADTEADTPPTAEQKPINQGLVAFDHEEAEKEYYDGFSYQRKTNV